jgi:large subunit ribosomal protein L16
MGSGKGDIHEYVAVVRPGRILFEMGGIPEVDAREAMRLASAKLPVRTKFMIKE